MGCAYVRVVGRSTLIHFVQIDAPANVERSNKAKHEDGMALKDLAARLEKDPDALADKIGLRGTKLDEESQKCTLFPNIKPAITDNCYQESSNHAL